MQCEGRDQSKEDDTIAGHFRGNYVQPAQLDHQTRAKRSMHFGATCASLYIPCVGATS